LHRQQFAPAHPSARRPTLRSPAGALPPSQMSSTWPGATPAAP
jgi:hypothetical protein